MFKIKLIRNTSQYVGKIFATRTGSQFKIVRDHRDLNKMVLEDLKKVERGYANSEFAYSLNLILERIETGEYTWKN